VTWPSPVSVREARDGDVDAVGRLLHEFNREFGDPAPDPGELAVRVRELLAGGDTGLLVAGDDPGLRGVGDDPVGLALMRFRRSLWGQGLECYLAELYVVPARRGQGIGRALMEGAIDLARVRGAEYMDLGTAETDVAARHLYESLGFDNHEGKPDGPVNLYYERQL
jgi:ribosomal protein S18 acetylase RimI-like enzyme